MGFTTAPAMPRNPTDEIAQRIFASEEREANDIVGVVGVVHRRQELTRKCGKLHDGRVFDKFETRQRFFRREENDKKPKVKDT